MQMAAFKLRALRWMELLVVFKDGHVKEFSSEETTEQQILMTL